MKPMILNRTNASLIPVVTGARTAGEAKGKKVVVFFDPTVSFGGKAVGGLRLKRIPGPPRAPGTPKAPPPPAEDFNDEIPI